jgi:hypothetical protein
MQRRRVGGRGERRKRKLGKKEKRGVEKMVADEELSPGFSNQLE